MSTIKLYDAKLMRRYYDQRALSSIGKTTLPFKLLKAAWGSGFVETIGGNPSVTDIPIDTSVIQGEFARTDLITSYSAGRITIRAVLPTGSVAAGTSHEFTALYILDQENEVVAIMASTPVSVHDKRSLSVEGYIDTNIA
ncbi:MAG: hypothetical protein ACRC9V_13150 [Aeromonas sp.]